jgi:hypothetical protein
MSSGGAEVPVAGLAIMLAFPVAATVIAAAAVAAAALAVAGGTAVLLARAAGAAGEALATRITDLGDLIRSQEEAYVTAQQAAELWQLGVTEVVTRNARIAAMAATARSLGDPTVTVPCQFDVSGKCLRDMYEWCRRADEQITSSQRELAASITAAASRRLAASLPPADVKRVTAERLLAERRERLTAAAVTVQAAAPADRSRPAADLAEITRQVEERLGALDPEARPEDVAAVAEISALAKSSPLAQARTHVDHLGGAVTEANNKVRDARAAARLLQGVELDPLPCDLDAHDLAVVTSLKSVVAGEHRLDEDLTCDAQRMLGKVEAAGARSYLREQIRQIMEANGYQLEGDFTTLRPGVDNLTLTRPDWADHHLRLVLGEDKLSYVTLRDHRVEGDAAALADRERCAQSRAAVEQLSGTLRSQGVDFGTVVGHDDPPVLFLGRPPKAVRATASVSEPRQAALPRPGEGGSR